MFISASSPTLPTTALSAERYNALDAARAIALLIGIFFHGVESLVSFLPPMLWAVKDAQTSVAIDVFFYVAHVFRMQAFFLLSGFFAHMLYHRRGAQGFLTHRAARIGLPLLLFWPVIVVSVQLLWTWGYQQMGYLAMNPAIAHMGYWQIVAQNFRSFIWMSNGFPLTHLWFLYYLLWFCAGVLVLRPLLAKALDKQGKFRQGIDSVISFLMNRWWGSLLFGLCTIPAMWGMKNGFGVDTPDVGLLPKWASFLVYGGYFTFGWFLHRQKELLANFKKYWKVNLCISLILVALVTASFLSTVYQAMAPGQQAGTPAVDPATMQLMSMIYNSFYGVASMTAVFAFIGAMLTFFSRPSRPIRYLSDASYWMYLIHLPVVVFFQVCVYPYEWHWLLKVMAILLPSLAVLLLSYQFLVRSTFIGVLLNGRRYGKPAKYTQQANTQVPS
ncbi:acyltransferase family protein [Rhodocytophaga aerolata]|uniref:Acyltransferase family protein n=1 Tax=Rhodocytophaga aerolata TaxID=455078 RepID=A0ABT8R7V3_9BACT|nr:acyltransferase family protein [Rhodocytophaga aerolata]MDO1448176.1 acyltransferase family protein [Rhodocytophaga aerolata]